MKIRVYSEFLMSEYQCGEPHVIVSIRNPCAERVILPDNPHRIGVLWLSFHDVEGEHDPMAKWIVRGGEKLVMFDDVMAMDVARFMGEHKSVGTLLVNCEMGISRSSGLAAAVSKVVNGEEGPFVKTPGGYDPNKLVYDLVLRAFAPKGPPPG